MAQQKIDDTIFQPMLGGVSASIGRVEPPIVAPEAPSMVGVLPSVVESVAAGAKSIMGVVAKGKEEEAEKDYNNLLASYQKEDAKLMEKLNQGSIRNAQELNARRLSLRQTYLQANPYYTKRLVEDFNRISGDVSKDIRDTFQKEQEDRQAQLTAYRKESVNRAINLGFEVRDSAGNIDESETLKVYGEKVAPWLSRLASLDRQSKELTVSMQAFNLNKAQVEQQRKEIEDSQIEAASPLISGALRVAQDAFSKGKPDEATRLLQGTHDELIKGYESGVIPLSVYQKMSGVLSDFASADAKVRNDSYQQNQNILASNFGKKLGDSAQEALAWASRNKVGIANLPVDLQKNLQNTMEIAFRASEGIPPTNKKDIRTLASVSEQVVQGGTPTSDNLNIIKALYSSVEKNQTQKIELTNRAVFTKNNDYLGWFRQSLNTVNEGEKPNYYEAISNFSESGKSALRNDYIRLPKVYEGVSVSVDKSIGLFQVQKNDRSIVGSLDVNNYEELNRKIIRVADWEELRPENKGRTRVEIQNNIINEIINQNQQEEKPE